MSKIRKVIIEYTKKHVESLLSRNPYSSIQTYIYTYIYIKYKNLYQIFKNSIRDVYFVEGYLL